MLGTRRAVALTAGPSRCRLLSPGSAFTSDIQVFGVYSVLRLIMLCTRMSEILKRHLLQQVEINHTQELHIVLCLFFSADIVLRSFDCGRIRTLRRAGKTRVTAPRSTPQQPTI
jgi:hypothetical protein